MKQRLNHGSHQHGRINADVSGPNIRITNYQPRKADLPTPRFFAAAAAVVGIIYVVGGIPDLRSLVLPVATYNPKTDTWANRASIPTGRATLAACALDGVIYAIGGIDGNMQDRSVVEAYDPRTNQWSRKANLPQALEFLTASVANGRIYVFQGTKTFAYDPQTDTWTTKAAFSPRSQALMSATVDGIIYLFGGFTEDMRGSYDFVLAYDPGQDCFSARRMRSLRLLLGPGCGTG